ALLRTFANLCNVVLCCFRAAECSWSKGVSQTGSECADRHLFGARHRLLPNSRSPDIRPLIPCLTIATQDGVALNIVTELIMPGRPPRHLDEPIKQPTASSFKVEALR